VRGGRIKFPVIFDESYQFRVGKGVCLRQGKDVTFAACGIMVHQALAAADWLASEHIHAEVLNLSTIKPLDEDLLVESVAKTGCLVTCEEHLVNGGLGGACAEALGERYPAPFGSHRRARHLRRFWRCP
jgi:transketolase